jgi:small ligand-binding sensory domain FIST
MPRRETDEIRVAAGLSGLDDSDACALQVCEQCVRQLGQNSADLALLSFSGVHVDAAEQIARLVRERLSPGCLIGVSAESVLGGETELERVSGISLLAARLPGVDLKPFTSEQFPRVDIEEDELTRELGEAIGAGPDFRGLLMMADPYSTPLVRLLPALNRAAHSAGVGQNAGQAPAPIIGGLASSARRAGENILIVNDRLIDRGVVGVSFRGNLRLDTVVSQGCRGFGPTFLITKARGNIIMQLGGRPALEVAQEQIAELTDAERALLGGGLFIGRAVNEYKERFGRDDFLIRGVVNVDQKSGAIAVADLIKVGQTVRFHLRDARSASDDLALLLDAQKLHDRPAGAFLITCNGRGTRLFDRPHHDAFAVARAFDPGRAGEELAKGGTVIDPAGLVATAQGTPTSRTSTPRGSLVPLAGFFASGEIGPVGGQSYMHGHTACIALFRKP